MFDANRAGANQSKLCQNCNHAEVQHEILEGAYYKCVICNKLCSGKFYQEEQGE